MISRNVTAKQKKLLICGTMQCLSVSLGLFIANSTTTLPGVFRLESVIEKVVSSWMMNADDN